MSVPSSALEQATERQPRARVALAAEVSAPVHAYLFAGPPGSGKTPAAREFAAALLAQDAADPDAVRRRVLADPSPHPDLAWLRPVGTRHLVEDVRERVVGAVSYRPFESGRRVFVIEAAEGLAEESQNALLKTLEEPPPYVHVVLLSSSPGVLLETVLSRCRRIDFVALPPDAIAARLAEERPEAAGDELLAAARLCDGDVRRAAMLASEHGALLRECCEGLARASRADELADAPWRGLLDLAEQAGAATAEEVERAGEERAAEAADDRFAARIRRDAADAAKRAKRRARTEALDLGLALIAGWMRDLAAVADGAAERARNVDRTDALAEDGAGVDASQALVAAELAMETRRSLRVNVSEELALEALAFRLAEVLR